MSPDQILKVASLFLGIETWSTEVFVENIANVFTNF